MTDHHSNDKTIDESEVWSEEDLQDVTAASIEHSENTLRTHADFGFGKTLIANLNV